jgi:hypothetical protein
VSGKTASGSPAAAQISSNASRSLSTYIGIGRSCPKGGCRRSRSRSAPSWPVHPPCAAPRGRPPPRPWPDPAGWRPRRGRRPARRHRRRTRASSRSARACSRSRAPRPRPCACLRGSAGADLDPRTCARVHDTLDAGVVPLRCHESILRGRRRRRSSPHARRCAGGQRTHRGRRRAARRRVAPAHGRLRRASGRSPPPPRARGRTRRAPAARP